MVRNCCTTLQFGEQTELTINVLEHFLHLLLAPLTVDGYPQHQDLKQDTRTNRA